VTALIVKRQLIDNFIEFFRYQGTQWIVFIFRRASDCSASIDDAHAVIGDGTHSVLLELQVGLYNGGLLHRDDFSNLGAWPYPMQKGPEVAAASR
jgi:hypothetical protein